MDGQGKAPSAAGLDWLTGILNRQFPGDLAVPYLYPTPAGGVQAEWSFPPHEITLEIDLDGRSGEWHELNLKSNEETTRTLTLDVPAGWEWVCGSIRRLAGDGAG